MSEVELSFEHVGTMACGERLLICDVQYLPGQFAGMRRGAVGLDASIEIEAGTWQVVVARDPEGEIRFAIFSLDDELDADTPLERAETEALLRVDSGRITAIDPDLREDPVIQTAVLEAPREQVPCMLRALEAPQHEAPRGVLLDVDVEGVLELHAGPDRPRRSLLLALTSDL